MSPRRLFFLAYTLTGCSGLIYEVVWTRLLTLRMGHTVAAVSTVLAAVLGGMALGALAAGALASRRSPRDAVRLYGLLELAVGASALLVPLALRAFDPLLAGTYANGDGEPLFGIVRLATSLLAIGIPAAAMGATFPVAARAVVHDPEHTGRSAGGLYAANTLGAAVGAAAAGFMLLPDLGLSRTTWTAVALNLIAAAIAFVAAPGWDQPPARAERRHGRAAGRRRAAAEPGRIGPAAFALAVTGFSALANEVVWTRVIALIVGPTTYAFGAMLAVFIAGLAAGSFLSSLVADRIGRPAAALAMVMLAVAVAPLVAMLFVEPWSLQVARMAAAADVSFQDVLRAQALSAATLLLPVTLALGAAFPIALRVALGSSDRVAHATSIVYAANTAGAIAGALVAGFVLIPAAGLQHAILIASTTTAAAVPLVMAATGSRRRTLTGAGATLAVLLALWMMPHWDMTLLSSGAYKYAPYMRGPELESMLRAGTVLFHREGATGTVSVRRVAGSLTLSIDGKVDASNRGDMLTQKLLAHIPLLLHPRPVRVGVIGLGSGVTLGAALTHPVQQAEVIEISPEVVAASTLFEVENHQPLADPRARLVVGDGRTHVMFGNDRYDVLISEPSNPWMAGVAALFTREFFDAARRSLADGGLFCQWAHTYDISDADLRSIVATFQSVFPNGTMWLVGAGDLLLIGSPSDVVERIPTLAAAMVRPGVAADLREVNVLDADSLLSLYIGGPVELQRFASGALVQTDDRMALEFSAPRSIVGRSGPDEKTALRRLAASASLPSAVRESLESTDAASWRNRGRMLLRAEAHESAYEAFARAVSLDPSDRDSLEGLVSSSVVAARTADAWKVLGGILEQRPDDVTVCVQMSRLAAATGDLQRALEVVQPAMVRWPDDPRPFEQAASVLADAGDTERLRQVVLYMGQRWPDSRTTRYYRATLFLQDGRPSDALTAALAATEGKDPEARAFNLAGVAAATLGRRDEAHQAFEQALARDPRDASIYVNLGLLAVERGDAASATRWFSEALVFEPESTAARDGLARADAMQKGRAAQPGK